MCATPSGCPAESKTRPPPGPAPSFPLPNQWSTIWSHFPLVLGVSLKTVPALLYLPPESAVPYKFPLASRISPEEGIPPPTPLSRLKECRIVSFHLPPPAGVSLKAVPQPCWPTMPPNGVVPYMLPCASKTQPVYGLATVFGLTAEGVQHFLGPVATPPRTQLENRTRIESAAPLGRPVEVPGCV